MRSLLVLASTLLLVGTRPAAAEPDRIGTVLDRQGTALVRPSGRDRWSPLRQGAALVAGDAVRTPLRGANAVECRLASSARVVLGPGAFVELADAAVRIRSGEVGITGKVTVRGPGGFERELAAGVVRVAEGRTTVLERAPKWLTGYRASTTGDWTGSLIAQVDGRDVALAVGYHKVGVEIRDQVARTTIEQSFRNLTKHRLEGVFYFPLPAEASISGFAMWIGDEMVQADIVEKRRARRIFEQIMREKKDPGLLEWSGGNLFQARVFPIEPHSDKRIRIRYTQVLPREGDTLRYRYALRSDATRRAPLKTLAIDLRIQASAGIEAVTCRGVDAQVETAAEFATIRHRAEEVTPASDLEVAVRLRRTAPLTVVPHRRGEDGYFMVRFTPPGATADGWTRNLVPEGAPLDLIVVADTSASMDAAARARQAAFVTALLGLLGEKDRFRLAACDLDAVWSPNTKAEEAVAWLERRRSLGWTDLARAFAAVHEAAHDHSLVVYVGDGIGTAGTADPQAWAQRLRATPRRGRWHAVSVSSAYELSVLRAIGPVRRADSDPAGTAQALLAETALPVLDNLKLRFEGLQVARVYPAELPRLPEGRQQIVLGRFLPGKGVQKGRLVLEGTRDGRAVRYATEVEWSEDERSNSFLPRLWARRHLDTLLAEGRSPETKREIVSFSEQYQILTPLTSFLVLESDEQRERFGVVRRVHMRDGESFFADARDAARREALRGALRKARGERELLRRKARAEIATLGEHLHARWSVGVAEVFHAQAETASAAPEFERGGGNEELSETKSDGEAPAGDDGGDVETDGDEAEFEEEAPAESSSELAGPTTPAAPEMRSSLGGRRIRREPPLRRRARRETPVALPFPALIEPATKRPDPRPSRLPKEIAELLRQLDRRATVRQPGGLEITIVSSGVHEVGGWITDRRADRAILGATDWHTRATGRGIPTQNWVYGGERGVLQEGFLRGRKRQAKPGDVEAWAVPLPDLAFTDLVRRFAHREATTIVDDLSRPVVILTPADGGTTTELHLDLSRKVVLEIAQRRADGRATTTAFSKFVQVRGRWWPTRAITRNARKRIVRRTDIAVRELSEKEFGQSMQTALADHDAALFLTGSDPAPRVARQAVFENRAGFQDRYVLALLARRAGRWDAAFAHWNAALQLAPDGPVRTFLRAEWLQGTRRGPDLLRAVHAALDSAAKVADREVRTALVRLSFHYGSRVGARERLALARRTVELVPTWTRRVQRHALAAELQAAGLDDEELALRAALLAERKNGFPEVAGYVAALLRTGRRAEAERVVEETLAKQRFAESERDDLYRRLTDLQWDRRDLKALAAACERWCGSPDAPVDAWVRRGSVQMFRDDAAGVDAWIGREFAGPAPESMADAARLSGAVALSLGRGWHFWSPLLQRWERPLDALARRLIGSDGPRAGAGPQQSRALAVVQTILSDYRFRGSDLYASIVRDIKADLGTKKLLAMSSAKVSMLVHQVSNWDRFGTDQATWDAVVKALGQRRDRERIAPLLLMLFDARQAHDQAIAFQRNRFARTRDPAVRRDLFSRLMHADWSVASEGELIDLARGFDEAELAGALRALTARLVAGRAKATLGSVAELEKLPRAERRDRTRTARRRARLDLAARYHARTEPAFQVERLGLLARAGHDPMAVAAEAKTLFDAIPPARTALRERCIYAMAYAATRTRAPAAVVDRVRTAFLAGARTERDPADESAPSWREHTARLLLALGRFDAVQGLLAKWIVPAQADARWFVLLGRLRAARGEFPAAVAAWQSAVARDGLAPDAYLTLAEWSLAAGDDAGHAAALRRRWAVASRHRIDRFLWREMSRVERRGDEVPDDLDPDAIRAVRALLGKAADPAAHLYVLRRLYETTKDFRLLAALPGALSGHTPEVTYGFLQRLSARILSRVHEEATLDRLGEQLRTVRAAGAAQRDPTEQRALLLFEAAVERRAAEVTDAGAPRAERAQALLAEAFATPVAPSERAPLASLLALLSGAKEHRALGDAVLDRLKALHRAATGAADLLPVVRARAEALRRHQRKDDSRAILAAALDAVPASDNAYWSVLSYLVRYQHADRRYHDAERRLTRALEAASLRGRRTEMRQLLFQTWILALQHGGKTGLGSGDTLFRAAAARIERSLREDDPGQMVNTLRALCRLHEAAKQGAALQEFADKRLPALLDRSAVNRTDLVNVVAASLRRSRGARSALAFVLDRLEQEPEWLVRTGRGQWNYHYAMAQWRQEAKDPGLNERLLPIVLRRLERDLVELRASGRSLCRHSSSTFWREQAVSFAEVAEAVVKKQAESPGRVFFTARYLAEGLGRATRAMEIALALEARGRLDEQGRAWLVGLSHREQRWALTLPVLDKLVREHPYRLSYAVMRIRALGALERRDEADAFAATVEARWREQRRMNEGALARLARACAEASSWPRAVRLFEEVVALHRRTRRNGGVGGGTLSHYQTELSAAYSRLGRHSEAVDAAAAAVVAWGRNRHGRTRALNAYFAAVSGVPDLDAFVREHEKRVREEGRDAPLLRKALARAYVDRKFPQKAIPHAEAARALQPTDPDNHAQLVELYEQMGRIDDARAARFAAIAARPLEWEPYAQLAPTLDAAERERAWTSLAEIRPLEAGGHRMLAQARQEQKRPAEAVPHWRRVIAVRPLEPAGWLGLAKAQIAAGDGAGARKTLDHVFTTRWDRRFGKKPLQEARALSRSLKERGGTER